MTALLQPDRKSNPLSSVIQASRSAIPFVLLRSVRADQLLAVNIRAEKRWRQIFESGFRRCSRATTIAVTYSAAQYTSRTKMPSTLPGFCPFEKANEGRVRKSTAASSAAFAVRAFGRFDRWAGRADVLRRKEAVANVHRWN